MKTTYRNLINEWFAHLDSGYATPPYTNEELRIFNEIKKKYTFITEEDGEDVPKEDPTKKEKSTPEERFVGKTANFMDTPNDFVEYILTNYSSGIEISNLQTVFEELTKLSTEKFQDVTKIINSGTNRNPDDGSFSMGENERTLFLLLKKNVILSQGTPEELFLAIVFGGRVKGSAPDSIDDLSSDIELDGTEGIILDDFATSAELNFGRLSPDAVESLDDIVQMSNIVLDKQTDTIDMTREGLNDMFRMMSDPEIVTEIEELLRLFQTSEIKVIQRLGKKAANILGEKSPQDLVLAFLNSFDQFIRSQVTKIGYWSTIDSEKYTVYIEPSSDIYDMLKSDLENRRLSKAVSNLNSYNAYVNGESINKKLLA